MKNMDSIIPRHTVVKIVNPMQKSFECNCRKKDSCPLNDECLTPKVIYRAVVSTEANNNHKFFFSLGRNNF